MRPTALPDPRAAARRLGGWLDHWVPRRCALCCEPLAPRTFPGFCTPCIDALPGARRPRCRRCGLPAPDGACGGCVPPGVDRTIAAADYAAPLDRVVTTLKFGRELALARPLGELVAAAWLGAVEPAPLDCLVPVPLSAARIARRGFNQALEMARAMAAALAAPPPVLPGALVRTRDTPAQSGLRLADRRGNLAGCFACPGRLDGLRVGVVDDVMTSGGTLAEAARTLRAAGAAGVVALVAARTP
jgi:ComF family protein